MTKALHEEYAEPDRPAFGPRSALAESFALKRPGSLSARRKVRLGRSWRVGGSEAVGVTCRPRRGNRPRGHQRELLPVTGLGGHPSAASSVASAAARNSTRLPNLAFRDRRGVGVTELGPVEGSVTGIVGERGRCSGEPGLDALLRHPRDGTPSTPLPEDRQFSPAGSPGPVWRGGFGWEPGSPSSTSSVVVRRLAWPLWSGRWQSVTRRFPTCVWDGLPRSGPTS
jgi:hypothetical protein